MDQELVKINKRFNFWAHFYDLTWLPLNSIRKKSLHFIQVKANEEVLDLACGTGDLAIAMSKTGATIEASDLSQAMINKAKNKDVDNNINFFIADSSNIQLNKKFDKIVISFALHEMPLELAKKTLSNCLQYLKQKGELIIIDFYKGRGFLYFFGNIFLKLFECKYYSNFINFDLDNFLLNKNLFCFKQQNILFNLCILKKFKYKHDRK